MWFWLSTITVAFCWYVVVLILTEWRDQRVARRGREWLARMDDEEKRWDKG